MSLFWHLLDAIGLPANLNGGIAVCFQLNGGIAFRFANFFIVQTSGTLVFPADDFLALPT